MCRADPLLGSLWATENKQIPYIITTLTLTSTMIHTYTYHMHTCACYIHRTRVRERERESTEGVETHVDWH